MPLTLDILKQYKMYNSFVETGTSEGEGVALAVECGFSPIFSIETILEKYVKCLKRFENNKDVFLLYGDSTKWMDNLVKSLASDRAYGSVYWLDAHYSSHPVEKPAGDCCPLLNEIHSIAKNNVEKTNHVLLIDDMRYFDRGGIPLWNNINTEQIMREINSNFYESRFCRQDSPIAKNDILVAFVVI